MAPKIITKNTRKILTKGIHGRIKILVVDFWRDRNEPAIDVEVYVNGKFCFKPSKIFGKSNGYIVKHDAIIAAYEYAAKVFDHEVNLNKEDWEK